MVVGGTTVLSLEVGANGGRSAVQICSLFETDTRFSEATNNTGNSTFGNTGMELTTGSTATSSVAIKCLGLYGDSITLSSRMRFSTSLIQTATGTDFDSFFGVGYITVTGSGITFTEHHIGFRERQTSSGGIVYECTSGNGTQVATAVSSWAGAAISFFRSTGQILFYVNGVQVAAHTTNLPTGTLDGDNHVAFQVTNVGVAVTTTRLVGHFSYEIFQ